MRIILTLINLLFLSALFFIPPGYSQTGNPIGTGYVIKEEKGPKLEKLEEEIKNINFLNSVDLSKEQLELILGKAKEIEGKTRDLYRKYGRYYEILFKTEKEIKRQMQLGRTQVSKSLFQKWILTKEQCNLLFFRHNNLVGEAVKTVEGQLKDFQLMAMDNVSLCVIPVVSDNYIGEANKQTNLVSAILDRARKIPAEKYEEEKESFVGQQIAEIKTCFCPGARLGEESTAKKEILKSIDEARRLDEVEFRLNRDRIGEELSYKIILINPLPDRSAKIYRFLLSSQSIPILEAKLKSKKRP